MRDIFDRLADLDSITVEDGHITLVNGRGPAEYLGEVHVPGVRPPSVERQAYELACDEIARSPEVFSGVVVAAVRNPRHTHLVDFAVYNLEGVA